MLLVDSKVFDDNYAKDYNGGDHREGWRRHSEKHEDDLAKRLNKILVGINRGGRANNKFRLSE